MSEDEGVFVGGNRLAVALSGRTIVSVEHLDSGYFTLVTGDGGTLHVAAENGASLSLTWTEGWAAKDSA